MSEQPSKYRGHSLYVGNLPDKAFFDLDLKKLFEEHGFNVTNANVVSDPLKKPSVPAYGYVTFAEDSELERCLKTMNNIKVQSQSIILNRQGDNTRNPLANIII